MRSGSICYVILDSMHCFVHCWAVRGIITGAMCMESSATCCSGLISAAVAAGNPVNALGQAIAQQQFNQLVDVMTYEELYEYFGGAPPPPQEDRSLADMNPGSGMC